MASVRGFIPHTEEILGEDEKLISGRLPGLSQWFEDYGGDDDTEDEGERTLMPSIIIPNIYRSKGWNNILWQWNDSNLLSNFAFAQDSRDAAWQEVEDAGEHAPNRVAAKLIDGWEKKKRSRFVDFLVRFCVLIAISRIRANLFFCCYREYLNATMDTLDLDNIYYAPALLTPASKVPETPNSQC